DSSRKRSRRCSWSSRNIKRCQGDRETSTDSLDERFFPCPASVENVLLVANGCFLQKHAFVRRKVSFCHCSHISKRPHEFDVDSDQAASRDCNNYEISGMRHIEHEIVVRRRGFQGWLAEFIHFEFDVFGQATQVVRKYATQDAVRKNETDTMPLEIEPCRPV